MRSLEEEEEEEEEEGMFIVPISTSAKCKTTIQKLTTQLS